MRGDLVVLRMHASVSIALHVYVCAHRQHYISLRQHHVSAASDALALACIPSIKPYHSL